MSGKWIATVMQSSGDPMEVGWDNGDIVLVETREKYGAMALWARQWFKTTGANRTRQRRGNGRIVVPENGVMVDIHTDLNFRGDLDYSKAYSQEQADSFVEFLADLEEAGWSWVDGLGSNLVDVYVRKNGKLTWKTLWLRYEKGG